MDLELLKYSFEYRRLVNNTHYIYQYVEDKSFHEDNGTYVAIFSADQLKDYIILNDVHTKPTSRGFEVHTNFLSKMRFSDTFPYRHHILGPTWSPEKRN